MVYGEGFHTEKADYQFCGISFHSHYYFRGLFIPCIEPESVGSDEKTVDNNLGRLVMEMEAWFGRETDFTKFLAYHLSFRETLEKNPFDNVEIAQVLNKTVEPIFWYFISSDSNIKNIRIVTPYVRDKVGSFLEPSGIYEEEAWYQEHQENFRTKWTVEGDELYATRTVLDTATTSRPIGVMRTEFFLNRMLEPAQSMDYLENGILITDGEGTIIIGKSRLTRM